MLGGIGVPGLLRRLLALAGSAGASLIGFIHTGAGAIKRTLEQKLRGVPRSPQDYGTVDGVADNVQLQAAIDAAFNAGGGVVKAESDLAIAATVTVKAGVTLDMDGYQLKPKADINVIRVNEGGRIINSSALCTAAAVGVAFTARVYTLYPTQNVIGARYPKWCDNLQAEFDIGGGGVCVTLDATEFYIQEMVAGAIAAYGGSKALELLSGDEAEEYCNGNIFQAVTGHDGVYLIHENPGSAGPINGNAYHVMDEQNGSGAQIVLEDYAFVTGLLWDRPLVTFNGDNNLIVSPIFLMNIGEVTDNGDNNQIITPRFKYHDHRSISTYSDGRSDQTSLPGEIVFRDWVDGGKIHEKWVYGGVGAPVALAYTVTDSGAGGINLTKSRALLQASTTLNDTAQLSWNAADIKTGQYPRFHGTFLTKGGSGANEQVEIGFYGNANNHILFISDTANARWICRCTVGGVSTDQYIAANFNRLQLLSLICSNSKIVFQHGEAAFGNSNIAIGRANMTNSVEFTNSAQFPINVLMGPLIKAVCTTGGTAPGVYYYGAEILRSWMTKTA